MVWWVDGTYGVGKTCVANRIAERLNETRLVVLDSDYYYQELGKKNPLSILFGGTRPQNNLFFLNYFKSIIEERILKEESIIISMAATMKECKEVLIEYLLKKEGFVHIILEADLNILVLRIEEDTTSDRDKQFAIDNLHENIRFLNENYEDAFRVNTNGKTIDCIVDEIIDSCYFIK